MSCTQCIKAAGCLDPSAGGATCETPPISLAPHFTGTLPDGNNCSTVFQPSTATETQICLDTLDRIFSSACAATLTATPCLCGTTDTASCLAGTATPKGALYDTYACDFNSTSSTSIQSAFQVMTTGAGVANAIILCAAMSGCDCF